MVTKAPEIAYGRSSAKSREILSLIFTGGVSLTKTIWPTSSDFSYPGPSTDYRGTSLTRERTPPGPYGRPMPRVPGGFLRGGLFLMGEVNL